MTTELPDHDHIAGLLPAYVNGTLDALRMQHVRTHLLHCESCQRELASWESLQDAAGYALLATPSPSASLMEQVWMKIDAPAQRETRRQWSIQRIAQHLWLVFKGQAPLISKSIWLGSALVILLGCGLALFMVLTSRSQGRAAELVLALFASVVAATGMAFIFGAEHDPGFEITLSTPTSIRIVMICRVVLVMGYNLLLSMLASALVAIVHGGSTWEIIQLWLGPMLFLASLSILLSLTVGSVFAVVASLALEAVQAFAINGGHMLQLLPADIWQTNPTLLFLAVLLIVFAVLYAPRQPRLT